GEPKLPRAGAAATVVNTIGARAVPGHADEQTAVVAEVGRPPVLRVGHDRLDVLLDLIEVEAQELLRIVEVPPHRIAGGMPRVQAGQVQLLGPPLAARPAGQLAGEGTLTLV